MLRGQGRPPARGDTRPGGGGRGQAPLQGNLAVAGGGGRSPGRWDFPRQRAGLRRVHTLSLQGGGGLQGALANPPRQSDRLQGNRPLQGSLPVPQGNLGAVTG